MKVVDLFAGAGGLSLGFEAAGFEVVAAYDAWDSAKAVYDLNFDHELTIFDLSDTARAIEEVSRHTPTMIVGGPPCQDFSSAGKRDESLGRADLTVAFAEIVAGVAPEWLVMENVERSRNSKALARAIDILKRAGYTTEVRVLDASRCGAPQRRKRLIVVGDANGRASLAAEWMDRNLSPTSMTLRGYLGDALGVEHYYRHPRSYARRGVFSIDEPSPTIRGVNRPIPDGYPGHPGDTAPVNSGLRPLTTRERSLIQTFPPDYRWTGNRSDREQLIGNAVPVRLAEFVARSLASAMSEAGVA